MNFVEFVDNILKVLSDRMTLVRKHPDERESFEAISFGKPANEDRHHADVSREKNISNGGAPEQEPTVLHRRIPFAGDANELVEDRKGVPLVAISGDQNKIHAIFFDKDFLPPGGRFERFSDELGIADGKNGKRILGRFGDGILFVPDFRTDFGKFGNNFRA